MNKFLTLPIVILTAIFGRISWRSPAWLKKLVQLGRQKPLVFMALLSGLLVVLAAVVMGIRYYQQLPTGITIQAKLSKLTITENQAGARPDDLIISFSSELSKPNKDQKRQTEQVSVARLDLLGQKIESGIALAPAKKGRWRWLSDNQLSFTPETDWPPGMKYQVNVGAEIFAPMTKLASQSYDFVTPQFSTKITQMKFYQDPQAAKIRQMVATLVFSHPVDKQSLQHALTMKMSAQWANQYGSSYPFTVRYSKNLRQAYIQSAALVLPEQPDYMRLTVAKGVSSVLGGEKSVVALQQRLLIPDKFSFLKIESAKSQIVRNKDNQPEQVITLVFTDAIDQQALKDKLAIYLLPERDERGRSHWSSARSISAKQRAKLSPLPLKMIENPRNASNTYSFIVDVQQGRYLYLHIAAGLMSKNHFVHASFYDTVLRAPQYPKEVQIAGQGSIMTYSGQHKLSILSRGVKALKYSLGRVREDQLYHLVSQTYGDISNPEFSSWSFNQQDLAQYSHQIVDIGAGHAKKANYSSLDLSQFLTKEHELGLFFITVQGWDRKQGRKLYGVQDKRLVLITDLGLIVKNNADKSHDVFVQSLSSGEPVAGAKVELLGRNGIALYARQSSPQGHVTFPSTRDFSAEQAPSVYVVKYQGDIAFIPFQRYSRQINLSTFDIGGDDSRQARNKGLNAFMFSDRGIYRPGETVNLASIVKQFDLAHIQDIPLELVVRGPRQNEVKVRKLTLTESGLFDFQYRTEASSDTGNYRASLHLVRSDNHRGKEIGAVAFKVEEFQPDRMKIQSKLLKVAEQGWTDQPNIEVEVSLQNLFGIPAQNRKVSGQVIIEPARFAFKQYQAYKFTDPLFDGQHQALSINQKLARQKTDDKGLAKFNIELDQFKQGVYRLSFISEGFEADGGRSVRATNTALISPLSELVGYKSDGKLDYINLDSQRSLEFIAIDKSLNQVAKPGLRLKRLQIQHISTLVKQPNGTYQYQSVKKETLNERIDFAISSQGALYQLDTAAVGDYAIEIIDQQGRRLARIDYNVVGQGNRAAKLDKSAQLSIQLNKTEYVPGETIEMHIKAPYAGAGLISIETDRVEHFKWFKSDDLSSIQSIMLPAHIEGSAYVNVTFVRDVSSKEIFTSPLSYAVKPVRIAPGKRKIELTLKVNEIVRPGQAMTIEYSAAKPAKMVIFAIDQGILQVANYQTPDPLAHFLKKKALGVTSLTTLDLILPEFSLVKNLSASGGDAGAAKALAKNLNPFARKTDKPAVFWSGLVDASSVLNSVSFAVPDTFSGTLKIMAVAVSEQAVGAAHASSLVRGPFVLSPNVLSQAAPGDEFMVTLGIANLIKGSGKQAEVEIELNGSKHLQIIGNAKAKVKIDEGAEGRVSFKVKANAVLGVAELSFKVAHKQEQSRRSASISIRAGVPYVTRVETGFAQQGQFEIKVKRKLYANLAKQSIAASSSPLLLVDGLTSYLASFPHGCTEQVVSKVFPLVGLMTLPTYAPYVANVNRHFSHVLDKLRQRQLADGGFSFWPNGTSTAHYPSIYVMQFLIEAQSLGYPVPTDMMQKGHDYLVNYVGLVSTTLQQARNRAKAIYLLSVLGEVTTNYLVDLESYLEQQHKKHWKTDLLATYMAATYQLMQQQTQAQLLVSGYQWRQSNDPDGLGANEDGDFESPLAHNAQYIWLLAKHFTPEAKALKGEELLKLTTDIFNGEYNTISSAYSILALGAYSKLTLAISGHEKIEFFAAEQGNEKVALETFMRPFLQASYAPVYDQLSVSAEQPVYYLHQQSGFDKKLASTVVRQGIEIQRDFVDQNGNIITKIEQGSDLTVRLRVRALGTKLLTNIALIDLLPGGFEINSQSVSRGGSDWSLDYVDIRADRLLYYGSFGPKIRELSYQVKATAAGQFLVPSAYAESMYNRRIRAVSMPGSLTVFGENMGLVEGIEAK